VSAGRSFRSLRAVTRPAAERSETH
jgi:hypothetical protein